MANIKSFPNNQDTYIGAEDVMKWLHGRTSGVFGADGNASVTALSDPGMSVQVSDGTGWMANSGSDGVVWWNDHESVNGKKLQLHIDPADGVLNRIDRIIVEWKTTNYVNYPEIKVLKGALSSGASAPDLTNNSTIRQISLAQVSIPAGTTAITASMITDERLNPDVCGLVSESVSIDTSTMNAQFQALLAAIQQELAQIESDVPFEMMKLQFNNVSVPASAFVADSTYEDYGYRAAVDLPGVTSAMIPEVILSIPAMSQVGFASVSESYNGGVYIYADGRPESSIVIPTIILWKGNSV